MPLHPYLIAFVLIVFGLMAVPPMLSLARERRFGLASLMVITLITFVAAGIMASSVNPNVG
jgi:hypothetical protein